MSKDEAKFAGLPGMTAVTQETVKEEPEQKVETVIQEPKQEVVTSPAETQEQTPEENPIFSEPKVDVTGAAVAKQRKKTQEAREAVEQLEVEKEELKAERQKLAEELESLKKKSSPEQAAIYQSLLDGKDDGDVVEVKDVRAIVNSLASEISTKSSATAVLAAQEYVKQINAAEQERIAAQTRANIEAKSNKDISEWSKETGIDFNKFYKVAVNSGFITSEQAKQIAFNSRGNVAKEVYDTAIAKRNSLREFDSFVNPQAQGQEQTLNQPDNKGPSTFNHTDVLTGMFPKRK